jgi:hypothetical protein
MCGDRKSKCFHFRIILINVIVLQHLVQKGYRTDNNGAYNHFERKCLLIVRNLTSLHVFDFTNGGIPSRFYAHTILEGYLGITVNYSKHYASCDNDPNIVRFV